MQQYLVVADWWLHYWQQLLVILLVEKCNVELCKRQVFLIETGTELVDWLIQTCIVEFAAATDVEKDVVESAEYMQILNSKTWFTICHVANASCRSHCIA